MMEIASAIGNTGDDTDDVKENSFEPEKFKRVFVGCGDRIS